MIDLFITLLSMGLDGYKRILDERNRLTGLFRKRLEKVAGTFEERVLNCPRNTISFGITLDNLVVRDDAERPRLEERHRNGRVTKFGSMLFTRCISGTRVVPRDEIRVISGHAFVGFGSSHETYPHAYMTSACAVGMGECEMNEFFARLERCWKDYIAKRDKESKKLREEDGNNIE
jgi:O-phospho-L-seryl-tRNASec:L-selenocysteinyl-tRNA synthase